MIDELKTKLQAEIERLNHEINSVLPKEIEKARAHGDLRENSEYKAALERQQFAQARASHLRARLGKLSGVSEKDIPDFLRSAFQPAEGAARVDCTAHVLRVLDHLGIFGRQRVICIRRVT